MSEVEVEVEVGAPVHYYMYAGTSKVTNMEFDVLIIKATLQKYL